MITALALAVWSQMCDLLLLWTKTGRSRELVVSAGESVEVTLPRNEVELNAFVIPTPLEGNQTSSFT